MRCRRGRGIRNAGPCHLGSSRRDSGRIEASFFDEQYQQYREILVKDALLLIEGKVRFDEFANTWVLRAAKVSELERLREKEARRIVLRVKNSDGLSLDRLQALLAQFKGGNCHVALQFMGQGARGTFSFGAEWNVRPTPTLIEELETLLAAAGSQSSTARRLPQPPRPTLKVSSAPYGSEFPRFEQPIAELEAKIEELKHLPSGSTVNHPGRNYPSAAEE